MLTLLMGMRNSRIAAAMAAYGFNEAELDEGWGLLQAVGKVRFDASPVRGGDKSIIDKLDAWENRWFPIASATLERRFPAVHERVFKNLSQTEGPAVTVRVRTLLERLDQMAAGAYGPEGAAAKSQLELRGLAAVVMNEARALLETVGKIANPSAPATDTEALAKAESDLWAWYLEWSQIARVAVTQRALLRQLGFVASRGRRSDEEEEVDDEAPAVARDGRGIGLRSSTA